MGARDPGILGWLGRGPERKDEGEWAARGPRAAGDRLQWQVSDARVSPDRPQHVLALSPPVSGRVTAPPARFSEPPERGRDLTHVLMDTSWVVTTEPQQEF